MHQQGWRSRTAVLVALLLLLGALGAPREARAACTGTPPVFIFTLAFAEVTPTATTPTLILAAGIDDPDGTVPSSLASVMVTGPLGTVFDLTARYNFPDLDTVGLAGVSTYSLGTGLTTFPTGTYVFSATDVNGCTTTSNFVLSPFPTLGTLTITSPALEEVVNTITPTVTWSPVTNAVNYRVRIEDAPTLRTRGQLLYTSTRSTATVFTIPKGILTPGRRYALRIEALDTNSTGPVAFNARSVTTRAFSVAGPKVGVAVNKRVLTSADTLTLTFRFRNLATTNLDSSLVIWLSVPGQGVFSLIDQEVVLPANFDSGNLVLSIPVNGLPLGEWAAGALVVIDAPQMGITPDLSAKRIQGFRTQ